MEINLERIKELSTLNEAENEEFEQYLKGCNHHQIDRIVHELNQKYSKLIDCTKCGNCCKKLIPALSLEETKTIAEHLGISYEDFKNKYIARETARGFTFKGTGCPLLIDNKCIVYESRPEVCRSFPHMHEDNINHRLINIIANSELCPIIYNILEELKDLSGFNESH